MQKVKTQISCLVRDNASDQSLHILTLIRSAIFTFPCAKAVKSHFSNSDWSESALSVLSEERFSCDIAHMDNCTMDFTSGLQCVVLPQQRILHSYNLCYCVSLHRLHEVFGHLSMLRFLGRIAQDELHHDTVCHIHGLPVYGQPHTLLRRGWGFFVSCRYSENTVKLL